MGWASWQWTSTYLHINRFDSLDKLCDDGGTCCPQIVGIAGDGELFEFPHFFFGIRQFVDEGLTDSIELLAITLKPLHTHNHNYHEPCL